MEESKVYDPLCEAKGIRRKVKFLDAKVMGQLKPGKGVDNCGENLRIEGLARQDSNRAQQLRLFVASMLTGVFYAQKVHIGDSNHRLACLFGILKISAHGRQ